TNRCIGTNFASETPDLSRSLMPRFLSFLMLFALAACQTMPDADLTSRQIAVLKENGFQQVGSEWQLGMPDRLLFDTDASTLLPQQTERIGQLARVLSEVGIVGAKIEG